MENQCFCIKLLREEMTENKNRVTHIKSLLNQINTKDDADFMIEPLPSDPVIQSARVNMSVFLNEARADDILEGALVENSIPTLSFDAFAAGLGNEILDYDM